MVTRLAGRQTFPGSVSPLVLSLVVAATSVTGRPSIVSGMITWPGLLGHPPVMVIVGVGIMMFSINPKLALFTLVPAPLVDLALGKGFLGFSVTEGEGLVRTYFRRSA